MNEAKIAAVTGANKGIGFEIARQLAALGVRVIATARDEARGKKALEALTAEGGDMVFYQLEVTDPESVARFYNYVEKEFGRLDILVNNAGVFLDKGVSGLEVGLDAMRGSMEANVYGPLALCQAFIPLMQKNGYGRVVNVSSGMGQLAKMGRTALAYRVSKAAVNAVTRVLAAEVEGENILVNTMHPGWIKTDMGGPEAPGTAAEGADTAVWLATLPDGGPSGGFFKDRVPMDW